MTERRKDAEILTEKVDELIKLRDDSTRNISIEINRLLEERKKMIEPFQKKIEELKDEYLDKYLKDSSDNPVRVGDVIAKNSVKYKVLDRYQQKFLSYLGNPRVEVKKYNKDGELKGVIISLYSEDLKNYTKVY